MAAPVPPPALAGAAEASPGRADAGPGQARAEQGLAWLGRLRVALLAHAILTLLLAGTDVVLLAVGPEAGDHDKSIVPAGVAAPVALGVDEAHWAGGLAFVAAQAAFAAWAWRRLGPLRLSWSAGDRRARRASSRWAAASLAVAIPAAATSLVAATAGQPLQAAAAVGLMGAFAVAFAALRLLWAAGDPMAVARFEAWKPAPPPLPGTVPWECRRCTREYASVHAPPPKWTCPQCGGHE